MARLSFRCDEDLVRRVDETRGMIPREAWLRRAIEVALHTIDETIDRAIDERVEQARSYRQTVPPPDPDRRRPLARSSSQAKRDVAPVPKRGEKK